MMKLMNVIYRRGGSRSENCGQLQQVAYLHSVTFSVRVSLIVPSVPVLSSSQKPGHSSSMTPSPLQPSLTSKPCKPREAPPTSILPLRSANNSLRRVPYQLALTKAMYGLWEWSCWRLVSPSIKTNAIETSARAYTGRPSNSISVGSVSYTRPNLPRFSNSCSPAKSPCARTGWIWNSGLQRRRVTVQHEAAASASILFPISNASISK